MVTFLGKTRKVTSCRATPDEVDFVFDWIPASAGMTTGDYFTEYLKPAAYLIVQFRFAFLQLLIIGIRFTLDLAGDLLQPLLVFPCASLITTMPFMVGEILVVGVPL